MVLIDDGEGCYLFGYTNKPLLLLNSLNSLRIMVVFLVRSGNIIIIMILVIMMTVAFL